METDDRDSTRVDDAPAPTSPFVALLIVLSFVLVVALFLSTLLRG